MRCLLALLLPAFAVAQAQNPAVPRPASPNAGRTRVSADPQWRILNRPAASLSARDLDGFERYLSSAVPYCIGLDPNDYEANREMARRMMTYLATVNTAAADAQTRAAAIRVTRALAAFPCAFPVGQPPAPAAAPARQPGDPPFEQRAPELEGVSAGDKDTASELRARYEADAARAASVWRNAETMRLSLAARGMALNAQTAASVGRFQLFLEQAAAALREHDWDEAKSNLQAVESETQKVAKAVGQ